MYLRLELLQMLFQGKREPLHLKTPVFTFSVRCKQHQVFLLTGAHHYDAVGGCRSAVFGRAGPRTSLG